MRYGMMEPWRASCYCLPLLPTQHLADTKESGYCLDKSLPAHRNSRELMSLSRLAREAAFWLQCSPVLFRPTLSPEGS